MSFYICMDKLDLKLQGLLRELTFILREANYEPKVLRRPSQLGRLRSQILKHLKTVSNRPLTFALAAPGPWCRL